MRHTQDNATQSRPAIAYIRVSTVEQADDGVSLDQQRAALQAYATLRGFDLLDIVVDAGVSAGKPMAARDGGRRVLDLVRRGQVAAVLAFKLDRLFRDASDCLAVVAGWDRRGVALHLVDLGGQALDSSSAMGRFFLTVMAGAAELERNQLRERTAAAMQHKISRREYTGGEPPYGWRVSDDGINLVEHRAEQSLMSTARELRDAGLSLRKIGARLTEQGLLPRSGGAWHAVTVRGLVQGAAA